jgi:uncharacterized Tic20 family protein
MNEIAAPPVISDSREKLWNMFCHLSGLVGYVIPFGWILGPLIVWQIRKHEQPSIIEHGKEAVNFQLSMLIWVALAFVAVLIVIGFFILPVLGVLHIVFTVIAGVKANDGIHYKYPMTIRFIK